MNSKEFKKALELLEERGMDREYIYEAMVLAFCYLCLHGDKAMDENEYYILRCFFEQGVDYAPSSWQQFKDEW